MSKYIANVEHAFKTIEVLVQNSKTITEEKVKETIEYAKHYLGDAKHYQNRNELETGLISIAYCEGLLDALRLLGVVEFSWLTSQEEE
jgi:FAD synthetase